MATVKKKLSTTEKGLGWKHQQAADALKRAHRDGSPCDWDGRPMYLDRTRNWDYDKDSNNPSNGELQADHSEVSRAECIKRGIPVPPPNRLLHAECNRQRGKGGNDHLAWINSGKPPVISNEPSVTTELAMPWPKW